MLWAITAREWAYLREKERDARRGVGGGSTHGHPPWPKKTTFKKKKKLKRNHFFKNRIRCFDRSGFTFVRIENFPCRFFIECISQKMPVGGGSPRVGLWSIGKALSRTGNRAVGFSSSTWRLHACMIICSQKVEPTPVQAEQTRPVFCGCSC